MINPPDSVSLNAQDFTGGLNAGLHATAIGDNQYAFGRNIRVRNGGPEAIKSPKLLTGALTINRWQGIEAVGQYLLVFCDGLAYTYNLLADSAFLPVDGYIMSSEATEVFTCLVPGSYNNNKTVSSTIESKTKLADSVTASPGCLVVQDGVTQPTLILADGTARRALTYAQWDINNREYVPICKQMVWTGDILFGVAPDGNSINRSVTGRPLDFVVAIDKNGNKAYDASGTSHKVDFNQTTALLPASGQGTIQLAVSSINATRLMIAIANDIYGEPRFGNPLLFSTGALNARSVVDTLGDSVLIDGTGLRSFNATKQLVVESNNDIFSRDVSRFFGDTSDPANKVVQDVTAAVSFSNYALFAVKTIYGYGVLVYDEHLRKFVSFDQYAGVGAIRQFCVTKAAGIYRLFFMTDAGVYEAFALSTYETADLYTKEIASGVPEITITPRQLTVQFSHIESSGTITAYVVADHIGKSLGLLNAIAAPNPPVPYPLSTEEDSQVTPFSWQVEGVKNSYAVGVRLQWDFGGQLQAVSLINQKYEQFSPLTGTNDRVN